jgi:hypothetical protein
MPARVYCSVGLPELAILRVRGRRIPAPWHVGCPAAHQPRLRDWGLGNSGGEGVGSAALGRKHELSGLTGRHQRARAALMQTQSDRKRF